MKKDVKPLTYGAMIGAIYGVVFLLIRILLTDTDSIIYVVAPIPLAIYSFKFGLKNGLIACTSIACLSFLILDPYYAILLAIPNLLIGTIYGFLENKKVHLGLRYLILFALCFIFDIMQFYLFNLIFNVSIEAFYQEAIDMIGKFYNEEMVARISNILKYTIPAVFILYSFLKVIINVLFFNLITVRLRMKEKLQFSINMIYNPIISVIYIISFIIMTIIMSSMMNTDASLLLSIVFAFGISILSILSIVLFYEGALYLINIAKLNNLWIRIFLALFCILLFPIIILLGIIANFKFYKKNIKKDLHYNA